MRKCANGRKKNKFENAKIGKLKRGEAGLARTGERGNRLSLIPCR